MFVTKGPKSYETETLFKNLKLFKSLFKVKKNVKNHTFLTLNYDLKSCRFLNKISFA